MEEQPPADLLQGALHLKPLRRSKRRRKRRRRNQTRIWASVFSTRSTWIWRDGRWQLTKGGMRHGIMFIQVSMTAHEWKNSKICRHESCTRTHVYVSLLSKPCIGPDDRIFGVHVVKRCLEHVTTPLSLAKVLIGELAMERRIGPVLSVLSAQILPKASTPVTLGNDRSHHPVAVRAHCQDYLDHYTIFKASRWQTPRRYGHL